MNQKSKRKRQRSVSRLSPSARDNNLSIAVANRQRRWPVKKDDLKRAVAAVLSGEGIAKADISIAVVSDTTMHEINRQFLNHDEPTDVISFVLNQSDDFIDGEIVVSADTAVATAKQIGWSAADELLLYVIHGALHLAGYDDLQPAAKRRMRRREKLYLRQIGIKSPAAKPKTAGSK
jgi:probable rRNA maturation factor